MRIYIERKYVKLIDLPDPLFCFSKLLKKASLIFRIESLLEKIFSMGINCMSLAVWLGQDERKCSANIVG